MNEGRLGAPIGAHEVSGLWRGFFWAAAIFNFIVGAIGMLSPASTLDGRITGLLIFAFGVVYMQVARDPLRFAQALWAGVIGKFGVVMLLAPSQFAEGASRLIAGVLAIDAVFAIGFLVFLLTRGDNA